MKLKKLRWETVIWTENGELRDALKQLPDMGTPAIYLIPMRGGRRIVRFYKDKNTFTESTRMTLKQAQEYAQGLMQKYYDDMKAKIKQIEKEIGVENEHQS